MCGIAGFVTPDASAADAAILHRMTSILEHRGPDDHDYFVENGVFLGHRRLSIVDLATGRQPMSNEDGSVWAIYNGEIFNHAAVRPELEKAGHTYRTRSDTETLLHAWEEYGAACIERFRGMFAFALWDRNRKTMFCARDRLGIKPFYYFWDGRLFAFASEIKALLQHPGISAGLETAVLPEYLSFGYVNEERTLFRNIRRLMPGHRLILDLKTGHPELRIERYWDVPLPDSTVRKTDAEWIAELRSRLEETVRMRLMSDVPLGVFLSGGVDSSAIAALIKRMTDGPVKTFSVGYREQEYSELGYAAEVAKAIGTDHHEITVGMDEFFDALPTLVWHEDEPITWPSSVSLYFVSKLAATEVKVVLTGEGSDELFAGYARYRWTILNSRAARAYRAVPAGVRRYIQRQLASTRLLNGDLRRTLEHSFIGRDGSIESLYLDNFYAAFSLEQQTRLLPSTADALYGNFRHYWDARANSSLLQRMLYADQKTYLAELLMKQDQMSMAASIESRVPLLDHQLVEFAASIPSRLKIRGGEQKYIFKKAVEDLLPARIIYRRKMGFPTPLRQWFLDAKARPLFTALNDHGGLLADYLNTVEIQRMTDRHLAGAEDATDRLWRLLNLQIWGDLFITGRSDRWRDGLLAREAVPSAV